jgi:hypothetical protein
MLGGAGPVEISSADFKKGTFSGTADNLPAAFLGTRVHEEYQTRLPQSELAGTYTVDDFVKDQIGTLTVTGSGQISGQLFGCSASGELFVPDQKFNHLYIDLDLVGCEKAGHFVGAGDATLDEGSINVILVDGWTGYAWDLER